MSCKLGNEEESSEMSFHSIYRHGFARAAACVTVSSVADPTANAAAILGAARACHGKAAAIAVFPELCLSGYAIEDLVMQDSLLDSVERGLAAVTKASAELMTMLIVGASLRFGARIYNCAVPEPRCSPISLEARSLSAVPNRARFSANPVPRAALPLTSMLRLEWGSRQPISPG